jgi:lipopolysaccharide/colanic/teichoic acid biosynthesis glycosyltransferase
MVPDAERLGGSATANDDVRLTSVGRKIRKYKLDELPQLWNVLKGEMSLVGPRPEVEKYVKAYTKPERCLLELPPGITDWATIWNSDEGAVLAGKPDPEKAYEEIIRPIKTELQLLYYRNRSLTIDAKIVFHTAIKIFIRNWVPRELAAYGTSLHPTERCDRRRRTLAENR